MEYKVATRNLNLCYPGQYNEKPCDESYSAHEIKQYLGAETYTKYEDRVQEQCIDQAIYDGELKGCQHVSLFSNMLFL
jgi:hypothetical protein